MHFFLQHFFLQHFFLQHLCFPQPPPPPPMRTGSWWLGSGLLLIGLRDPLLVAAEELRETSG
ncbi:hypothetical protein ACH34S_29340 [Actinomadura sp. 3N508]